MTHPDFSFLFDSAAGAPALAMRETPVTVTQLVALGFLPPKPTPVPTTN